jgi:hypothetical protein
MIATEENRICPATPVAKVCEEQVEEMVVQLFGQSFEGREILGPIDHKIGG